MSDKIPNVGPEPSPPPTNKGTSPAPSGLTEEERTRAIRALQADALKHDNPLSANLGILTGDLISLAQDMRPALAELHRSPARATSRATERATERYLRVVRQVGSFAQMQKNLPAGDMHGEADRIEGP